MPGDAEIRFLLAAAYAKLALRTPALEQLEILPQLLQADANVLALREAVRALPADRVELAELEANLRANIEALRSRSAEPIDLNEQTDAWRTSASARDFFRARTGDLVWRTRADTSTWERFDGQREMAAALRLEHNPSPTASVYPPPYFIEGIDPPWVFQRLCDSTPHRIDGHTSLVIVVQRDPAQFLDGLAQCDLSAHLADPRIRLFLGEDAGPRLEHFLHDRATAGLRAGGPALSLPSTTLRIDPALDRVVAGTIEVARRVNAELNDRISELYPPRDRHFWARRFTDARAGGVEPLRILIATSRYSTFVRHSAADLAQALRAAGCQVVVHMEPDAHALLEPTATMRAVADLRPDLILIPNYLRANLGSSYPASVPFVCWVQDAMPHLFEKDVGKRMGELDFIMGNIREEMFQSHGYPRSRALAAPMAASARKFHPAPVAPDLARRHACEIAYVSHHSQTPEELHNVRRAEGASIARAPALLDALFPRILRIVDAPLTDGPLTPRLRAATLEEVQRAGFPSDDASIGNLLNTYTHPIADRALRHKTLAWAAALAAKRHWRMHLYGRGWETHPTLAPMARGQLEHGEDLRACYQAARAHLHISLHTAIHQRVFECAMSGSLPICRLQADDLSQLEYLAAAHACRANIRPLPLDRGRRTSDGYRYEPYALDSCDEARRYGAFTSALGLPTPEAVWLNGVHAERLRSSPSERIDGDGESLWDLCPDPAALMFHDEATLERVLTQAVEDDAWRTEQSQALGDRARQRVTYDALANRIIAFVAASLAGEGTGNTARWYDTPEGRAAHAGTRSA